MREAVVHFHCHVDQRQIGSHKLRIVVRRTWSAHGNRYLHCGDAGASRVTFNVPLASIIAEDSGQRGNTDHDR